MPTLLGIAPIAFIVCAAALILYFVFRPKTVKRQISRYQSNLSRLEAIALKFPNFKDVVSTLKADAKKSYDEAMRVTDEKERIQSLERPIEILNPKFSQSLASIEFPKTKLDDLYEECSRLNKETNGTSFSISMLDDMITSSNRDFFDSLMSSNPTTELEANNLVNNSLKILDPATQKLEVAIAELREKVDLKEREAAEKLDADQQDKP